MPKSETRSAINKMLIMRKHTEIIMNGIFVFWRKGLFWSDWTVRISCLQIQKIFKNFLLKEVAKNIVLFELWLFENSHFKLNQVFEIWYCSIENIWDKWIINLFRFVLFCFVLFCLWKKRREEKRREEIQTVFGLSKRTTFLQLDVTNKQTN
jgi:hypothetical protein